VINSPMFFMGLFITVTSIVLYSIVHRLPFNPFLGFRIGYSYLSRDLWVKLNKVAALVFMSVGLVTTVLSVIIADEVIVLEVFLGLIIVSLVVLINYSSKAAELELMKIPEHREVGKVEVLTPFYPSIAHIVITLVPYVLGITFIALNAHSLPDSVAIHFTSSGAPDRFMPKTQALILMTFTPTFVIGLTLFFYYLGVKKPEIYYRPWLRGKLRIFVTFIYTFLSLTSPLASIAMVDTVWFNIYGEHLTLLTHLMMALIIVIIAQIIYFIAYITKHYLKYKSQTRII